MGQFLAFGEVMLRLSPPGRRLLEQASQLDLWTAGAEANVATALARLGHDAGVATTLPIGSLGDTACATLLSHGVDCHRVMRRAGRMGLYFVIPGAGARPTQAIYDRAGSAFAETPAEAWNWTEVLNGVDRLHLSGITPALGPGPTAAAIAAAEAAAERSIPVSFDGNYRAQLWAARDSNPGDILRRLVAHADILFGDHRDIGLMLGRTFDSGNDDGFRRASAAAAFEVFPKLMLIASTVRQIIASDHHRLAARIDTRDGGIETAAIDLPGIVDRIGAGDAFAAGVLHALRLDRGIEKAATDGRALAALKHSLPGDASLFDRAALDDFTAAGQDIQR